MATPGEPALVAQNLTRRFGPVCALEAVNLSIQRGEFFSLLGPSGCGKTTLLRLIAGLDFPDAGQLWIGGRDVGSLPAHQRPVNTVFQSYALFPHLTVDENISFGLRIRKLDPTEINARVRRVSELVELDSLGRRHPAQLSGGQKQRVALARALVNEPEILLLDEPLAALDLKLRRQLQIELHNVQRRTGITFVYVTHDQDEALVLSDRIAVMNAGKIEQLGSGRELYEQPRNRFVAQFLGAANVIEGTILSTSPSCGIVETTLGKLTVDGCGLERIGAVDQRVVLAIRPENIRLLRPESEPLPNMIRGRIIQETYAGAETHFEFRSADTSLRALVLNSQLDRTAVTSKGEFCAQLPPEKIVVLEN